LPPGVTAATVGAIAAACPRLARVAVGSPWEGAAAVLAPLRRLGRLDTLDLGGWVGAGPAASAVLPALARVRRGGGGEGGDDADGGGGGSGGDGDGGPWRRRAYRRLVLPPREADAAVVGALRASVAALPPALSWALRFRDASHGGAVGGLLGHPGGGALRQLALANVGAAGVAALAAAPAAVTARLVRLRLDSGCTPGRWALPRVDAAGVAAGLSGLLELELRGYRLTGGGLPLLLWAFGRAPGGGGGGAEGGVTFALGASPPRVVGTLRARHGRRAGSS